jgi:hypothetical protein
MKPGSMEKTIDRILVLAAIGSLSVMLAVLGAVGAGLFFLCRWLFT